MAVFSENFPQKKENVEPFGQEFDPVAEAICREWPPEQWREHRSILAVSGGADSVALLVYFVYLSQNKRFFDVGVPGERFRVVHIDHRLRGAESDADAVFVRNLAARFGLSYREKSLSPEKLAAETKRLGSLEAAARNLRYAALVSEAEAWGARFLLTGHHADDQLETVLFRLFRGSSFAGLTGIAPVKPLNDAVVLVRPLLQIRREELVDALRCRGETFRTDSTNTEERFARNRIRHELIPILDEIFPKKWENALERLTDHATEVLRFFDEKITEFTPSPDEIFSPPYRGRIPLGMFRRLPPNNDYAIREYFRRLWLLAGWPMRDMGSRQWGALVQMVRTGSPRIGQFPGRIVGRIVGGLEGESLEFSLCEKSTEKDVSIKRVGRNR